MAYGGFKDLTKRTDSNKVFRYIAFNITKNPKHDEYQRGLASMAYTFFDKKSKITDVAMLQMKNLQMNFINQLSENLKKEKHIYIDIFSKYAWVVPLKDKKVVTIVNSFQNFKSVIMLEYQNTKIFLLKDILQIDLKKFL